MRVYLFCIIEFISLEVILFPGDTTELQTGDFQARILGFTDMFLGISQYSSVKEEMFPK